MDYWIGLTKSGANGPDSKGPHLVHMHVHRKTVNNISKCYRIIKKTHQWQGQWLWHQKPSPCLHLKMGVEVRLCMAWINTPPPPEPTPESRQEKQGQKPGYGLDKRTPAFWAHTWKLTKKMGAEARLWPGQTHPCLLSHIWKSGRKMRVEARLWPGQTHPCLLDKKKRKKKKEKNI